MSNNYQLQTILALDTSCDETSVAVTQGERVLSNIISSQVNLHKEFGGVVPLIAKRAHKELIGPAVDRALSEAGVRMDDIEVVAVTIGPGLAIALEVGIAKAKELTGEYRKPLVAVNHMEGHLLSPFARDTAGNFGIDRPEFPALGLLVSGGHTELAVADDFGSYRLVGQTLDDAAGECFDKVARILDLGYPGGPIISKLAKSGNPDAFDFPVPMKSSDDLNFSFSGLKTACLYQSQKSKIADHKDKADFAASFERVVIESLIVKLEDACRQLRPKMILLGGGVAASTSLQAAARAAASRFDLPVYLPFDMKLLTDNAAMIGVAAYYQARRGQFVKDIAGLERVPNLSLDDWADMVL